MIEFWFSSETLTLPIRVGYYTQGRRLGIDNLLYFTTVLLHLWGILEFEEM